MSGEGVLRQCLRVSAYAPHQDGEDRNVPKLTILDEVKCNEQVPRWQIDGTEPALVRSDDNVIDLIKAIEMTVQ